MLVLVGQMQGRTDRPGTPGHKKQAYDRAILDLIRANVDLRVLLCVLGFKVFRETRGELRAPCIIHGGDNPTSFKMNLETGKFTCYSHKCELSGTRVNNDAIGLVMKVKKLSFNEAVSYLAAFSGINIESVLQDDKLLKELRIKQDTASYISFINRILPVSNEAPAGVSEEDIKRFISNRGDYFSRRGVQEDIQDFFEVGYFVDDYGITRASIPIRDENRKLVGVSGRRVDSDEDPRYLITQGFDKYKSLYNIHNASYISAAFNNTVIFVEGFVACWKIHSLGYPNVVACMGSRVLEEQAALAARCGMLRCVLLLDGDSAGRSGTVPSQKVLGKYMKLATIKLFETNEWKSPEEVEDRTMSSLIDGALSSL